MKFLSPLICMMTLFTGQAVAAQPSGLYLMTRLFGSSFEMKTWLFRDGRFAEEPTADASRFDFAAAERAAPGTTGTLTVSADQWTLRWADGRSQTATYQPANPPERCFYWNSGLFCRVQSFTPGQLLEGAYSGAIGGGGVGAARTYRFTADGRYTLELVGTVSTSSSTSSAFAGSNSSERGRYTVKANSVILQSDIGEARSLTAFPFEAGNSTTTPLRFYLGGFMLKRKDERSVSGSDLSASSVGTSNGSATRGGASKSCPERLPSGTSELSCTCSAELTRGGGVWGTDVYTADSAICRAALHAGVIDSSGGPIRIRSISPPASFIGSTRNGTTTERWGSYPNAFVIESPVSSQRK